MKSKFRRICPYGSEYLEKITAECKKDILLLLLISVILLFQWNSLFESVSLLYFMESIFLAVYLIGMEVPNYIVQKKENRVYRELLIYFSRVKHQYRACRHIVNATRNAAENMSYEIRCLANEMYRVLMEGERSEKIREYISEYEINPYLKLFLIQAYETSEKGNAFFSENIEFLRIELMEELYRRKKRTHEFAGYVFVAVTPFFMMPLLRQWGLEFAPELKFFYAGTGKLVETVTFVATLIIYGFINKAKEITLFTGTNVEKIWLLERVYRSNIISVIISQLERAKGRISCRIRRLLLLSGERISYGYFCFRIILLTISAFLSMCLFFSGIHYQERRLILERVEAIELIAPVASEEKKAGLEKCILDVVRQCIRRKKVTEEEISELLQEKVRIGNNHMERAVVQEIKSKLKQYENVKGTFLEFFLCLFGGFFAGFVPVIRLKFQIKEICAGAVHEVRQFQAVTLMERRMPGSTIVGLLEDMEVFSRCYKNILRNCINSYGANPQKALLVLKEEGSKLHKGFEELADAFLSVDDVGIEMAFAEVENNRRLLEKMTELESEIRLEKKRDSADLAAKIPMVLALGIYFVLPFFIYSLEGVYEVFELLENIRL